MLRAVRTSETSVDNHFTRQYNPWWWRQYAPLKRRSTIILHGSITQKTALNIMAGICRYAVPEHFVPEFQTGTYRYILLSIYLFHFSDGISLFRFKKYTGTSEFPFQELIWGWWWSQFRRTRTIDMNNTYRTFKDLWIWFDTGGAYDPINIQSTLRLYSESINKSRSILAFSLSYIVWGK
jgi:hypothetical protein